MRICITSEGKGLDSNLDVRFGRCSYFIIFDIDSNEWEVLENKNINLSGGAGIQSANTVIGKGVSVVISGRLGQNAYTTLKSAGIRIYISDVGNILEIIENFKLEKLEEMR